MCTFDLSYFSELTLPAVDSFPGKWSNGKRILLAELGGVEQSSRLEQDHSGQHASAGELCGVGELDSKPVSELPERDPRYELAARTEF